MTVSEAHPSFAHAGQAASSLRWGGVADGSKRLDLEPWYVTVNTVQERSVERLGSSPSIWDKTPSVRSEEDSVQSEAEVTGLSQILQDMNLLGAAQVPPPPGLETTVLSASREQWPEGSRTAMIRNIACRFMKEDVIKVLDAMGLGGKYDEVHVPLSSAGQNSNLGYAFVNFLSPQFAKECRALFHGRVFGRSCTAKLCEVVPARLQGAALAAKTNRKRGKKTPSAPLARSQERAGSVWALPSQLSFEQHQVLFMSF